MANLSIVKLLPKRVAELYKELKNITSKLHRTLLNIIFKPLVFDLPVTLWRIYQ